MLSQLAASHAHKDVMCKFVHVFWCVFTSFVKDVFNAFQFVENFSSFSP